MHRDSVLLEPDAPVTEGTRVLAEQLVVGRVVQVDVEDVREEELHETQ